MSIAFKSWIMDGYQMLHEKTYDTFDKLHDKFAVSPEELARHEKEIWSYYYRQKEQEYQKQYNKELVAELEFEQWQEAQCFAWEGSTPEDMKDALYEELESYDDYVDPIQEVEDLEDILCKYADEQVARVKELSSIREDRLNRRKLDRERQWYRYREHEYGY
jgi:hypothetical protein